MPIIISQHGKDAVRVDQSQFEKEAHLQEYIYNNPESIPLYDIKEDIRFIILAREFPTDSGPIDALGIDRDGDVYLVETKLYKNPDKRLVVAQVLDYGASLWRSGYDFSEFLNLLEENVQDKFKLSIHAKLAEFFNIAEEEVDQILESVRRNLDEGRFKFVVLMDKLHSPLKDLIVFLNENSKFDVYAVEMEFYKHDKWEILIPKLFGAEVKKDIKVSGQSRNLKSWDEASFFENAKEYLNDDELGALRQLYDFIKEKFQLKFGSGATRGSFSAQTNCMGSMISFLEITAKGKIQFYLNSLIKRGIMIEDIQAFVSDLSNVDASFNVEGDLAHSYSFSSISLLMDGGKIDKLKEIILKHKEKWQQ